MSNYKAVIHVDSGSHDNKAGYHVWIVLFDDNGLRHEYSYGPSENPFNGPGVFRDLPEAEERSDYKINIDITKNMFDSMKSKADALKENPPPYFLVDAPNLAHSILGSNCATVVSDILKSGGINKFENYFTPTQYQAHIESIQAMKSVFDKFTSLSDNLSGYVGDILDRINDLSGFFDNIDSSILDGLLNLSNGLRKIQSFFGANPTGYLPSDINSLFNMIDRSVNAPRDPLVLDLDGDGVETVGINNGILFDHDGDGIKHGTGWVKPDDGLLVVDWNGNGIIDNGKELFGDNTVLGTVNGQDHKAKDGFAALKWYDRNDADGVHQGHDGVIDQNDAIFSSLKVWQDLNQDGITQQGELKTLAELGISSINLDNKTKGTNQQGNRVDSVSSFQFSDGREHEMSSLFFAADTFRNSFTDKIPLTERTEKLPDITGTGGLRSLREAATLDNDLATLLETFSTASTRAEQLALVDDILWQWHLGSELGTFQNRMETFYRSNFNPFQVISTFSIEKDNRAGRYSVIEAFNGRPIENIVHSDYRGAGRYATHSFFPDLEHDTSFAFKSQAASAASALETVYQELHKQVFRSLVLQTRFDDILNSIDLSFDASGVYLDFSSLEEKIVANIHIHKADGVSDLFDVVSHFKAMVVDGSWGFINFYNRLVSSGIIDDDSLWQSDLASFIQKTTEETADVNGASADWEILLGDSRNNKMNGGNGDELILAGSGDDTIDGGLGNNTLSGGEGDDTLQITSPNHDIRNFSNTFIGGTGNDRLEGASSADIYVYNLGDGNDVIVDKDAGYSKTDKLVFGEGITKANISLQRAGDNLVVLVAHPDTGAVSTITIEGAISNNWRRIEQMVFADGTVIDGDWLDKLAMVGTAGDDNIAGTTASETIHGLAGNDVIDGGLGNNTLHGGEGDDTLKIAAPSDTYKFSNTLIGGSGNDRIEGASGADTYVYNLGDGNDVIVDKDAGYSKTDKLVFGEGITKANISLQRAGDNLVVLVAHPDTGAVSTITIEGAISNNWRRIEQMVFADGTVIDGDWLDKLAMVGTAGDDNIAGTTASETIYGLAGNDVIDGGLGNNTLHGGEGDDTLKIAAPSDTHNFSNTFIGGSGNDRIEGASGADTYIYNLGDGNDVIVDKDAGYSKTDKLVFGERITKANISLQRAGDNLVVLVAHPDTGAVSTITIEGAISNNWRRIEQMVFADGTVIDGDWHSQLSSTSIGTSNNDVIAGSDRPDWLFGLAGNDNLDGGLGNNRLFGGAGDDTLKIVASPEQAKNFHTMFIGGSGNDRLEGNSGHDIYVFNLGDGQDTIRDSGGIDKVVFGSGIKQSQLQLQRTVDNHLVIQLLNDHGELSGDQITIENAFEDSALVIERFEFADGNSVIIDVATTLNELALAQNWKLTSSAIHDVDFYAVDAKVSNLIDALNAFESDGEAEAEAAFNTTIRFEEPIY